MSRPGLLAARAAIVAVVATFVGWQTEPTSSGATSAGVSAPLTGAQLFHAKGCAACHRGPESSSGIDGFPPLDDAAAWAGDRRPGMSASDYLAESMRTPAAFLSPAWNSGGSPTTAMPDLGLTEAEIDALVDHLLQG